MGCTLVKILFVGQRSKQSAMVMQFSQTTVSGLGRSSQTTTDLKSVGSFNLAKESVEKFCRENLTARLKKGSRGRSKPGYQHRMQRKKIAGSCGSSYVVT